MSPHIDFYLDLELVTSKISLDIDFKLNQIVVINELILTEKRNSLNTRTYSCGQINNKISSVRSTAWYLGFHIHG